jgi:polyhydroxyalkanoate synthesis regulator phasin
MQDALRTYLELATGLTEASRKTVQKAVKDVVGRTGATAEQVKALTGDLLAANSANRDALAKLVRFEVDRALGVVGLATADEVSELTARVRDLERQLRAAETRSASPAVEPAVAAARRATNKATAAKRATAAATLPEGGTPRRTTKATAAKKTSAAKKAAR